MIIAIVQLAASCVTIFLLCVTVFWLRRAGQYNEVSRKLRAGESLTVKERQLLDKASR